MISRPTTSTSSQAPWQVVPAGDKWRVINRGDLLNSDYKVFTYPGFNAAFSIDPVTGVHDIVFLEYPQAAYTKEELEDPNSPIGSGIKKKLENCLICKTLNSMAQDQGKSPLEPELASPAPARQSISSYQSAPSPSSFQPPAQRGVGSVGVGEGVMPKYIPAVTSIGQKIFCTKLGGVTGSVILSMFADLLSGWSSDPGHKIAFRQISDEFIDNMGLCDERDIEAIKNDVARMYEEWQKGDSMKALKKGLFKDVGEALKEQGVQVSVNKQTGYTLGVNRTLRRSSAD